MLEKRIKTKRNLRNDILMRLYNQKKSLQTMLEIVKEDDGDTSSLSKEIHKLDEEILYLQTLKR